MDTSYFDMLTLNNVTFTNVETINYSIHALRGKRNNNKKLLI